MNIQMGNDEFILYLRKNGRGAAKSTQTLGKKIGRWLQDHGAEIVIEDQPCRWEKTGTSISPDDLPYTATQFSFDRALLPELYNYLDTL